MKEKNKLKYGNNPKHISWFYKNSEAIKEIQKKKSSTTFAYVLKKKI